MLKGSTVKEVNVCCRQNNFTVIAWSMFSQRKTELSMKEMHGITTWWRGDGATWQRIDEATRQRSNAATDLTRRRGNGATRQRIDEATRQRSNAATEQRGNGLTWRRIDEATRQRSNAATRQRICWMKICQSVECQKKLAWTDLDRVSFEKILQSQNVEIEKSAWTGLGKVKKGLFSGKCL
jgi:hypothetical protein